MAQTMAIELDNNSIASLYQKDKTLNHYHRCFRLIPSPVPDLCAICLDTVSVMECRLVGTCGHQYCFECLFKWSKIANTCPLCLHRFTRLSTRITSELQLNEFELILTGATFDQDHHIKSSKHFTLRKVLKCPKWKDLDNFWDRVISTGVVCKRKVVFILLIDANKVPNKDLIHRRCDEVIDLITNNIEDKDFSRVIDILLKTSPNNIFLMTLIVCCRKRRKDKK